MFKVSRKTKAKCYKCNKTGHFQQDCPIKKKLEDSKSSKEAAKAISINKYLEISENSDDDDDDGDVHYCFLIRERSPPIGKVSKECYIDSGVTSHISNSLDFFWKIEDTVKLANGDVIAVEGIGDGFVNCVNNKGKIRKIETKNVLYVPESESSLLSVKKLTELDFKIEFENETCSIVKDGINGATGKLESDLFKLNIVENVPVVKTDGSKNCIRNGQSSHRDENEIKQFENNEFDDFEETVEDANNKIPCRRSGHYIKGKTPANIIQQIIEESNAFEAVSDGQMDMVIPHDVVKKAVPYGN